MPFWMKAKARLPTSSSARYAVLPTTALPMLRARAARFKGHSLISALIRYLRGGNSKSPLATAESRPWYTVLPTTALHMLWARAETVGPYREQGDMQTARDSASPGAGRNGCFGMQKFQMQHLLLSAAVQGTSSMQEYCIAAISRYLCWTMMRIMKARVAAWHGGMRAAGVGD
jgi:hypothetical protein